MKIADRDGICRLERYEGNDNVVILPEEVNGKPLSVIGAKAFLSCREIERLELPETVERIEDWAFAHMKNLKEIVMPARKITFGKKVFLGCRNLKRVSLSGAEGIYEGISCFLASMVVFMEEQPVEPELAGDSEGQWEWLKKYDTALLQYLDREDSYGFEPAFIGWFNVEDVDDQQQDFIRERQKCKILLAFQRLLYGEKLAKGTEQKLSEYLLKAGMLVAELFAEEKNEYGGDVRYYKIWQRIGGFEVLSAQDLLDRLPDADPEVRAFLMECELAGGTDAFFADLAL